MFSLGTQFKGFPAMKILHSLYIPLWLSAMFEADRRDQRLAELRTLQACKGSKTSSEPLPNSTDFAINHKRLSFSTMNRC